SKVDFKTPFSFASTADTIGGNSGSPVLNRAGEFVGINFDRNRHGLVRNFVYTEEQARHISVHSQGILEALRRLYGAEALVRELTGGKGDRLRRGSNRPPTPRPRAQQGRVLVAQERLYPGIQSQFSRPGTKREPACLARPNTKAGSLADPLDDRSGRMSARVGPPA